MHIPIALHACNSNFKKDLQYELYLMVIYYLSSPQGAMASPGQGIVVDVTTDFTTTNLEQEDSDKSLSKPGAQHHRKFVLNGTALRYAQTFYSGCFFAYGL